MRPLTPDVEDSNSKITIELSQEEREFCNANIIEVLLYYIVYPGQFLRDLLCKGTSYYTYIINNYFNRNKRDE